MTIPIYKKNYSLKRNSYNCSKNVLHVNVYYIIPKTFFLNVVLTHVQMQYLHKRVRMLRTILSEIVCSIFVMEKPKNSCIA